ncbi:MAG: 4'-phosphopantetheinyl transferase superfamily protein [Oscillospiraceae bacterium]|nr:4'-phosphopantetheinyl transferase superfamily protein [Oscillospiraceae bacterium]
MAVTDIYLTNSKTNEQANVQVYYAQIFENTSLCPNADELIKAFKNGRNFTDTGLLQSLTGWWLVSQVLCGGGACFSVSFSSKGKPKISGLPFFSISHSGNYAFLAVAKQEVGCDIQLHQNKKIVDLKKLAQKVFSEAEIEYMQSSTDEKAAFYEIWAKKESYAKCTGQGLASINKKADTTMLCNNILYTPLLMPDGNKYSFAVCMAENKINFSKEFIKNLTV